MSTNQFGLIGLAVMGQNLVLNAADKGFSVSVYNRTASKTDEFMAGEASQKQITATYSLEAFVASLARPRKIQVMVKAGGPVDAVIDQLVPLLDEGDIIIDGGNSYFPDTERRTERLETVGLRFVGMGVSGGEEGARHGPSLMPGGTREAYQELEPLLVAISAKAPSDGAPCVTYIGPGGAGHYVKMVHNGIEYADMQLIAESYDLLRATINPSHDELAQIFSDWNDGELASFLMEITVDIFKKVDDETGQPLVDLVLDKAKQKGTGKWTSQNGLDIGAPASIMTAAVDGRIISSLKDERVLASKLLALSPAFSQEERGNSSLPLGGIEGGQVSREELITTVRDGLYAAKISTYAQGLALLRIASEEYGYSLNMSEIAKIWRAGCIIRAEILDDISSAFAQQAGLQNLLLSDLFRARVADRQAQWRNVVRWGVAFGVPVPAFSAALAYFDSYRAPRLPANLIQAQRDYFGAHTFERTDRLGSFHADWMPR